MTSPSRSAARSLPTRGDQGSVSRTTIFALACAFGLAVGGAVVVNRYDGFLDWVGLIAVIAGVNVATLTDITVKPD
jgi:predicted MFS family arabinose efflux permease